MVLVENEEEEAYSGGAAALAIEIGDKKRDYEVVHFVDKLEAWHRLPVIIGAVYLGIRRHLHQRYNLLHVGEINGQRYNTEEFAHRTADGTCNHPSDDTIGSQGTFLGRNMPPSTSSYGLLEPHPTVVASKLLARKKFIDNGKQFNMIACSWIQFMIHDWVDHLEDTEQVVHFVDKLEAWHRLPVIIGAVYLGIRRHLHQRYNLLHVGEINGQRYNTEEFAHRTADGTCNHPSDDTIGSQGTFLGRNMPPSTSSYGLLEPHPTVVASKLLARKKFIDNGKQFNMIACSWIQFMIHDWVDHLEDTEQIEIRAPDEISSGCPLKSFKFFKTKKVSTESPHLKNGSLNTRTPWW
ncbi:alpha-dioxygenase 2 [Quercus suber]|uniref:Alpha-dioxygenase 2 n=1 Tax=Quercus suber TaxID=58331 RepID=A0AAW0KZH1_QUESU